MNISNLENRKKDLEFELQNLKTGKNNITSPEGNPFSQEIERSIPSGIAIVDETGKQVYVNQVFCNLIGRTEHELLDKFPPYIYWPLEEIENINAAFQKTLNNEAPNEGFELQFFHSNGQLIPVKVRIVSFIDHDKTYYMASVDDISERKKTEDALKESENKYRTLVENSPDAIIIHVQGNIVFANNECRRLIGIRKDSELIGKSVLQFVHPDFRQLVLDRMHKMENEGVVLPLAEEKFILPNGSEIYAEVKAMPILFENKPAVQLILRDITKNKLASQELRSKEEKLRFLNNSYSEMLKLKDLDSIYKYISNSLSARFPDTIILCGSIDEKENLSQLESISGITSEFLNSLLKITKFNPLKKKYKFDQLRHDYFVTGKFVEFTGGFAEFSYPELSGFAAQTIEKIIKLHKIYAIGITEEDNLLATIHFLSFNKCEINESDFIEAFANQVGLILQKKIVVTALKESETKLLQLIADKNLLMSILAHDLKGPFSSLLGFSELLIENVNRYDVKKIENIANYINKSAQGAYDLLENLLMWIRSQSGKIPCNPQKLSFKEVCKNLIIEMKLISDLKNITIKYSSAATLNIFADVNMLKIVLRNLISNAVKFSLPGNQIDIYTEQERNYTTVTVSDQGIGIDSETISKLFDVSVLHTSRGTSNESGTGLGLLLCKEFVEKHGGRIWVESKPGKGSDFKFSLPRKSP